jgi:hypothetical protein
MYIEGYSWSRTKTTWEVHAWVILFISWAYPTVKSGFFPSLIEPLLSAFEEAMKYATEKMHRDKPISKFQSIKMRLADIALKYEASRWMTYRLGWLANNVKDPVQFAKEAALTKTFVGETVIEVAQNAYGGSWLLRAY